MPGRVHELDELILGRVAQAVVIRVPGEIGWLASGRIGQNFVDENVSGAVAHESNRHRIAGAAIALNVQIHSTGSAQIRRHIYTDFIQAREIRLWKNVFGRNDPAAHHHQSLRRETRAGSKHNQTEMAARRIEGTRLQVNCVEDQTFAGAVAASGEHTRGRTQDGYRAMRLKAFGIRDHHISGAADFGLRRNQKIHLAGRNEKDFRGPAVDCDCGAADACGKRSVRILLRLHRGVRQRAAARDGDAGGRHGFRGRGFVAKSSAVHNCQRAERRARRSAGRIDLGVIG